ncbi:GGDEF-domain containing protein, partial [Enterococcus hirae]
NLKTSIHLYPIKNNPFIIILINLNKFKSINNTYNHKINNNLLITITQHIHQVSPKHSILTHINSNKFILAYPKPSTKIKTKLITTHIINNLTTHYKKILSV